VWKLIAAQLEQQQATQLLLPIHDNIRKHWQLIVVCRQQAAISCYNSLCHGHQCFAEVCTGRCHQRETWVDG
jgi:Ulp1 family protease